MIWEFSANIVVIFSGALSISQSCQEIIVKYGVITVILNEFIILKSNNSFELFVHV